MEFFSALADILGAEVGQINDFIIERGCFSVAAYSMVESNISTVFVCI